MRERISATFKKLERKMYRNGLYLNYSTNVKSFMRTYGQFLEIDVSILKARCLPFKHFV